MGSSRRSGRSTVVRATKRIALVVVWLSASLALVVTSAEPAAAAVGDIAEISVPSRPDRIAAAPDGTMWFTASAAKKIGKVTPAGVVTEYSLTTTVGQSITAGSDGRMWFTQSAGLGAITSAGVITEYPLPANVNPRQVVAGPDNNLWFTTTASLVGRMTTAGTFTTFLIPGSPSLQAITPGPDGAMWFPYDSGGVGRITTAGAITTFPVSSQGVRTAAIGSDGNLWFVAGSAADARVHRMTMAGVVTDFGVPPTTGGSASGIALGADGNLYYTWSSFEGHIGRITPSGVVTLTETPTTGFNPGPLGAARGTSGDVWFAYQRASKVARMEVVAGTYPGAILPPRVSSVTPSLSPLAGGTAVTIRGTNFTGVSRVMFGDKWVLGYRGPDAANVVVISDTEITATIPPFTEVSSRVPAFASGCAPDGGPVAKVDVVLFSPTGISAFTDQSKFGYDTSACAMPSSISPATGTGAGGTTITINGRSLTGTTAVRIGGVDAASLTVVSDTRITAATPPRTDCSTDPQFVTLVKDGKESPQTEAVRFTYSGSGCPVVTSVSPAAGVSNAGGGTMSIRGRGLIGALGVKVGGTATTDFTVVSDSLITATVPPNGGCPALEVVVEGIVANSAVNGHTQLQYRCPAPPGVTDLQPRGGPDAGGTTVVITGYNFAGATSVRFSGAPATSFAVDSYNQITAVSPPHAPGTLAEQAAYVTVTNSLGTSPVGDEPARFAYGDGHFAPTGACAGDACPVGAPLLLRNGKVLVINGERTDLYDPRTGSWSRTGSCPATMCANSGGSGLAVLANGKVLRVAGSDFFNLGPIGTVTRKSSLTALYDPDTGVWQATTPLPVPRADPMTVALPNGKVLVAGGCRVLTCHNVEAYLFDPGTASWSRTGNMLSARQNASAILLDPAKGPCGSNCGKVLVAFGESASFEDVFTSAELYDPATGTWRATGSTNGSGRVMNATVQRSDGRVMVMGGLLNRGIYESLRSVEVFDPVTETWSLTGTLNYSHGYLPAAVALPDNSVLLTGGNLNIYAGDWTSIGELWKPSDGRWHSATASALPGRPEGNAMLLLPPGPASACGTNCGKVLSIGGGGGAERAELYTPRPAVTGVSPASGPAGATVTITGSGFASASKVRFGGTEVAFTPDQGTPDTRVTVNLPTGLSGTLDVTVSSVAGTSETSAAARFSVSSTPTTAPTTNPTTAPPASPTGTNGPETVSEAVARLLGYRLVTADGSIFALGNLPAVASPGDVRLSQPAVGIAHTPSGRGYWMVTKDGGIFAFGDARFHGSTGAIRLAKPIVGIAGTPSGNGYWLVAEDGGIFSFGDAKFFGSTGAMRLSQPVVGIAATRSGNGYWMVAGDGGIFAFGDARFHGSTGAMRLAQPVVGMTATPAGNGYRLVAADGGIFAFGDAGFFGSTGSLKLAQPMVGMASTPSGRGYVMVARDGGTFSFGDARFYGSIAGLRLSAPVVGIATG